METQVPASPSGNRLALGARRVWAIAAMPIISIVLALGAGAIVIVASRALAGQPFDPGLVIRAYGALLEGSFGSLDAIVDSLVQTTPLILGGLAVGLAFKAGLFNIGAQGQFLLGAVGAVAAGVALKGAPIPVAIAGALVAGMLAGALWGFIPGALKALSGAHEVVTTIMLNYIAFSVLAWAVSGPLDTPVSLEPLTDDVGNAALPIFIGRNGHAGIIIAFLAVAAVWWLLARTTIGFEIKTVGANPDAARYAGMHPRFMIALTMALSGLLAGLAGTTVLLGVTRNMGVPYATTVGFDSIAVALLARSNPVGIIFSALLFGAMRAGAPLMSLRTGVPDQLIDVIQATILLFLVANVVIRRALRLRGVESGLGGTATITKSYAGEVVVR
jgi:general nucleoside transport system permease protein